MLTGRRRNHVLSFLLLESIGPVIWMLNPAVLNGDFRLLVFLRDETTGRDKKYKGENQGADDVVLKRTSLIVPYENASGYPPDA